MGGPGRMGQLQQNKNEEADMSVDQDTKPLSNSQLQGPSEDFASCCESMFERRRNAGEAFDEAAYREAMELSLHRLQQMEEEGQA